MTSDKPIRDDYGVICECGKTLSVRPAAAAPPLSCSCGRRVLIPLPEEFTHRPVVLSAASLERRVWRLDVAGELSQPGPCARCGRADACVVDGNLQCERYRARVYGGTHILLLPLLLPFLLISVLMTWTEEERLEVSGRDTDLPAPLRLCQSCWRRLRASRTVWFRLAAVLVVAIGVGVAFLHVLSGLVLLAVGLILVYGLRRWTETLRYSALRDLLRPVPIYRQVLERYPDAILILKHFPAAEQKKADLRRN